jgi:virginiamycin A acetyltransferase
MKNFIQKLIFYINFRFLRFNFIFISKKSFIASTAKLDKAVISGNVQISDYVLIQAGVTMNCRSVIKVGRYSVINGPNTDFYSELHPIVIGSFCSIARNVSFQEFTHYSDRVTTHLISKHIFKNSNKDIFSKGPIEVGNDVWIGAHSVVLSGVKIGNGAIVASNSVVNKDIPPYAIVGGSPVKIIKYRFEDEIIELLENIKWWDWNIEKILKNEKLFNQRLSLDILKNIID